MKSLEQREPLEVPLAVQCGMLLVVMLLPSVTAWLYFVRLSGSAGMQTAYAVSKVTQFAIPALWTALVIRKMPRWVRPQRSEMLWAIGWTVAAVAAGFAAYFLYFKHAPGMATTPAMVAAKLNDMGLANPILYIAFGVFVAIPHSLAEEYYWRWFAFGQLQRVLPAPAAILISSLAFMSHHVIVLDQFVPDSAGLVTIFSLCVAFGGAFWAWLFHRYGSLWGAWFSHFWLDVGIFYIGYDLASSATNV